MLFLPQFFFTKIVNFSYHIVLYGPLWRVRNKSGMSSGRYQEGQVRIDKSRVTSQKWNVQNWKSWAHFKELQSDNLKAISTINMIEAYSDLHALRFILHIFFFAYSTQIMSQQTSGSSDCLIPAQLSLIPGTALPYPKHSSFLSRTQLFLIPDTALSYPAQLFHIWRTALLYPVHKICRSCVWD